MPQCHQCNRAAFYAVGEASVPLCLDCFQKLWQIQREQIEMHERQINFAAAEMEMAVGIPGMLPRYPQRPKTVVLNGATLNHINVSGGVVGSINTGVIERVDVAVSVTLREGHPETAAALKALTEAVANSTALQQEAQSEALEILATISEDLTAPQERRRVSLARTLGKRLGDLLSVTADLSQLWAQFGPILMRAIGA